MCEENPIARVWQTYARGNYQPDLTPTATPAEQAAIRKAYEEEGATIEAKGKDTLCQGFTWAVTPKPRFDFSRNHYRIKSGDSSLTAKLG